MFSNFAVHADVRTHSLNSIHKLSTRVPGAAHIIQVVTGAYTPVPMFPKLMANCPHTLTLISRDSSSFWRVFLTRRAVSRAAALWCQHSHISRDMERNVWNKTKKTEVNSLRLSDAYIRVNNLTIIASDNGLSPSWR